MSHCTCENAPPLNVHGPVVDDERLGRFALNPLHVDPKTLRLKPESIRDKHLFDGVSFTRVDKIELPELTNHAEDLAAQLKGVKSKYIALVKTSAIRALKHDSNGTRLFCVSEDPVLHPPEVRENLAHCLATPCTSLFVPLPEPTELEIPDLHFYRLQLVSLFPSAIELHNVYA